MRAAFIGPTLFGPWRARTADTPRPRPCCAAAQPRRRKSPKKKGACISHPSNGTDKATFCAHLSFPFPLFFPASFSALQSDQRGAPCAFFCFFLFSSLFSRMAHFMHPPFSLSSISAWWSKVQTLCKRRRQKWEGTKTGKRKGTIPKPERAHQKGGEVIEGTRMKKKEMCVEAKKKSGQRGTCSPLSSGVSFSSFFSLRKKNWPRRFLLFGEGARHALDNGAVCAAAHALGYGIGQGDTRYGVGHAGSR